MQILSSMYLRLLKNIRLILYKTIFACTLTLFYCILHFTDLWIGTCAFLILLSQPCDCFGFNIGYRSRVNRLKIFSLPNCVRAFVVLIRYNVTTYHRIHDSDVNAYACYKILTQLCEKLMNNLFVSINHWL